MDQRSQDAKTSAGATGPAAPSSEPGTGTPARRHRRRPAHVANASAATPSAGTNTPTTSAAAAMEAPEAAASAPTEPATPAATAARGTRRRSRASTPRLITPPRADSAETPASEAARPGGGPEEMASAVTDARSLTEGDERAAPGEPGVGVGGETAPAHAAARAAVEVAPEVAMPAATDVATPTPVRRYRFDRPAAHPAVAPRVPARQDRLGVVTPAPLPTNGAAERTLATATRPLAEADGAGAARETAATPTEPEIVTATKDVVDKPADPGIHGVDMPTARADVSTQAATPAPTEAGDAQDHAQEHAEADYTAGDHEATDGEDLSEVTSTGRRRRRRRRGNGTGGAIRHLEAILPAEHEDLEQEPIRDGGRGGEAAALETSDTDEPGLMEPFGQANPGHTSPGHASPRARTPAHPSPRAGTLAHTTPAQATPAHATPEQPYELYGPYQPEPWNIANSYQQIGQDQSPFGAPDPSPARGFGPQPRGTAGPAPERPERVGRGGRGERATDAPPMSSNQLGATVTHAIQQQTDRLLTELRHTQAPPSMTVMFPPLPSTERVGVFVDVANLLYSSRSLRIGLDFGRLLEFLRGNRRLIRAHAYAPTNPEPRAEQQFLTVVKGVGYRITTKNYKTFSSGAKKADLDLDLCMDIVRLVEARALDTVVLVSGDSDFLPLLEYCSDHGVRVEVAAFDDAAAAILRQSCDLFINLSMVEDIRA